LLLRLTWDTSNLNRNNQHHAIGDLPAALYNPRQGEITLKMIRSIGHSGLALVLLALLSAGAVHAQQFTPKLQNAIGHWQVVDSDGKPGGQVDTYLENGKLFGRVTQVRPGRTPSDVCDKCSGEYKNHQILGLVILRNFHAEGDDWVDGTAVDPENGKEYKGKIWTVGNDELHMRGFIGIPLFGRTETWVRMH
jgi:uncharacterized protein (DUF2147 family)